MLMRGRRAEVMPAEPNRGSRRTSRKVEWIVDRLSRMRLGLNLDMLIGNIAQLGPRVYPNFNLRVGEKLMDVS